MPNAFVKRNIVGVGLGLALIPGCSADFGADELVNARESEALRAARRAGRHPFRGLHPHPHHRHGDCGNGGSSGRGGSGGVAGAAGRPGPGGSISTGGSGGIGMGGRGGIGVGGRGLPPGGSGGTGGFGKGGAPATGGTTGGVPPACLPTGPRLIDDFEDGDTSTPSTPGGVWFSTNDETPGAVQAPNPWVPTPGGADGSAFAACTNGSGFMNWGALFGVVFPASETPNDLLCLDVSRISGIRFKARGSGIVRLNLPTRATMSTDLGGLCTGTECNYFPNAPLALTGEWQTFEIPWFAIQPGNQPFDPRDLFGIHYQAYDVAFPAQSPINFDFCVDDIELF